MTHSPTLDFLESVLRPAIAAKRAQGFTNLLVYRHFIVRSLTGSGYSWQIPELVWDALRMEGYRVDLLGENRQWLAVIDWGKRTVFSVNVPGLKLTS